MNIVNGVSRSPRNIDDTLDGSSQVCHLGFSYILSLLCSVFAERRECLAIGLGLSMHLDIASRKGRCSNRRNPSSNLSGGVNAPLELLPHVGHFLKHYNGITTAEPHMGQRPRPNRILPFPPGTRCELLRQT